MIGLPPSSSDADHFKLYTGSWRGEAARDLYVRLSKHHEPVMWALTVNILCQVAAMAVHNETSLISDIVITLCDNL